MRVFRWGILIPNSALTVLSVSTPRSPHRHECVVSDRLGQANQVDATAYRWLSIMRGGHRCVTQFLNQEDTGGLERTRRAPRLSTGGHARNRRDTEGHTVVPVRDREAPGSNPGPPTSLLEFRPDMRQARKLASHRVGLSVAMWCLSSSALALSLGFGQQSKCTRPKRLRLAF
jgi:hypothetical protein